MQGGSQFTFYKRRGKTQDWTFIQQREYGEGGRGKKEATIEKTNRKSYFAI